MSVDDPLGPVLNEPADPEAIMRAYAVLGGDQCRSPVCLAVGEVEDAFEIIEQRTPPDPQTLLHPETFKPWAWIDEHNAKLRRLLRQSHDRWPLDCAVLQKLAQHYSDYSLAYRAVEVAARISSPSFDCAGAVIAAFPDTPEIRGLLKDNLETCRDDRHPGCAYIVRAMRAGHIE